MDEREKAKWSYDLLYLRGDAEEWEAMYTNCSRVGYYAPMYTALKNNQKIDYSCSSYYIKDVMVSNESLSIAFLCLASTGEKESFLHDIKDRYKDWYSTPNGISLQNAIQLPNHRISEKIKYLQLALDPEKHGNKVREDMANRIAGTCLKQSLAQQQNRVYDDE
jgi:hypothetical protein